MIKDCVTHCPDCGKELKYYDSVKRLVRIEGGEQEIIAIKRLKCLECHKIHRVLPLFIFPYKHYRSDIISGVREGKIHSYILDYEDYPCEKTMQRWLSHI